MPWRDSFKQKWAEANQSLGGEMNWIVIVLLVLAVIFGLFLLGVLQITPIVD